MLFTTLVDAKDLEHWAERRDAQAMLPRLLRRLILGTVKHLTHLDFPAGEGVQMGGWDGRAETENGNAFVPHGISAWEMSTRNDIKTKADDDYEKRKADPRGINPKESTYIFVTPRRWGKKDEWQQARQAEGVWREVRVYDAENLELWLESAPAVHIWFSAVIGKHLNGVIDLKSWWDNWATATKPPLPPALLTAGRTETAETVRDWLGGTLETIALQSETNEEALAFYASVIEQLPPEQREQEYARTAIVSDPAAWNRLSSLEDSLTLIVDFSDHPDYINAAVCKGHRVVVPLGHSDNATHSTKKIPRMSREEARVAFINEGIDEGKARELAVLARRSLTSCWRKLAVRPEVRQPKWAEPAEAQSLLPFLLAGAWNEAVDGDREAIAELAGCSYEEQLKILMRWVNESDPPIRRIGSVWYITSKEDAWSMLSRYLTPHNLHIFSEITIRVLGTPDPRFDLPEHECWKVRFTRSASKYSSQLRQGISDTLALAGTYVGNTSSSSINARDYVSQIICRLLKCANADWRVWSSLSDVLPLLAEAAPDQFLCAVETGLNEPSLVLLKMFDESDDIFSSSSHPGLLWALENLAWSADYLARATLNLGKLTRLDPGGKLNNRPHNSLREIFLLWHPQTEADLDKRLQILDMLCDREPDVAWSLFRKLLPQRHGIAHGTYKPRWRESMVDELVAITWEEIAVGSNEIITRMLAMSGSNIKRWVDLIDILSFLSADQRDAIVSKLSAVDMEKLTDEDIITLRGKLRAILFRHRSYPDANWVLPDELLTRLEMIYADIEPSDPISEYAWVFDNRPALPEGKESDHDAYENTIIVVRSKAIDVIYEKLGLLGIEELVDKVENPHILGYSLGQSGLVNSEENDLIRKYLELGDSASIYFVRGFFGGCISNYGSAWAEAKHATLAEDLSPQQRAEILNCMPCNQHTWDIAESAGFETEQQYWRLVWPYFINGSTVVAARKLLKYGRPYTVVEFLENRRHKESVPCELILEALESILQVSPDDDTHYGSSYYDISELLDILVASEEIDEHRIASLEWALIPLFDQDGRKPETLHRELSRSPTFFVDVVALVYKAEGEESHVISSDEGVRANHAWHLLESWRTVPGTDANGPVDSIAFKKWISEARQLLADKGRSKVGDHVIGKVLSGSPPGNDGAWPHTAIRDVLEEITSEDLETGLREGIYNSRGVVSKNWNEGGDQERRLAERYQGYAAVLRDRWPRTADVMRRIAETYIVEAREEDMRAELREDLDQ